MFRIALHYICPYEVMEISIGDFGAFRDGLEAKGVILEKETH